MMVLAKGFSYRTSCFIHAQSNIFISRHLSPLQKAVPKIHYVNGQNCTLPLCQGKGEFVFTKHCWPSWLATRHEEEVLWGDGLYLAWMIIDTGASAGSVHGGGASTGSLEANGHIMYFLAPSGDSLDEWMYIGYILMLHTIIYNTYPLYVCLCVLSYVWLCDPRDCGPPGSSVHGISQARVLEWVAISYSNI